MTLFCSGRYKISTWESAPARLNARNPAGLHRNKRQNFYFHESLQRFSLYSTQSVPLGGHMLSGWQVFPEDFSF
ncbi:MAG: hypothetical protein ACOC2F_01705 [Bacteroidota bacterium]